MGRDAKRGDGRMWNNWNGGGSFAKNIHKIIYKKTTTQNQHFSNFEKIIL